MKKVLIAIIIAGVALVAFYGTEHVVHATTHKTDNVVQESNAQTAPSNNNNNNNNNNAKQSSQTNTTQTNNAQIKNTTSTSSSNIKNTTQKANSTPVTNKEVSQATSQNSNTSSTDWKNINATGVLSPETAQYFSQQLIKLNNDANTFIENHQKDQGELDEGAENGNKLITNFVNNKIVPAIQSKLSGSQLSNFNSLVSEFNQYNQNSVLSLYPNSHGGSILPLLQYSQAMTYENNFATYLIGGYVDTGVSPLLSQQFIDASNNIYDNATYKKFINNVSETQNTSTHLAGRVNKDNAKDVLNTYNYIYELWNTQIDNVYNYVKANSGGDINSQNLTSTEKIWISFRDNIVSQAGNGLTGINKEIAEKRMAIRMTQLQTYNLMGDLSSNVGVHY
ncbi:hypothetical protein [uncultured Clostridium sp.]|jgi:hypothetical protein|uniref:hypothetical protein n=1 Tax=uncultured Clostridium sp. TaxID=59620 RepID=UPI00261E2B54|nr:hypothetical protein [uncultured Clostridium sp.]